MTNFYSPAYYLCADETPAPQPVVATRYPEPAGLRWLRWQLSALWAVSPALGFRQAWRVFTTPRRLPIKSWEAPALADARRRSVLAETGAVAVYEWGPTAAPAVLLVHGWEHRASFWRAWVAPLLAAGYRVVALDGPAHGASAGRRTTLTDFGGAVQAVVDTVGEVRAIVAHSFGGAAVAGLPVRLPLGVALPRLVLLSVPMGPRPVAERFADFLHLPADLVRRFAGHIERSTGRSAESFAVAAAGPGTGARQVLVLHDEGDEIIPFAEGQQIAAEWPQARLHATHGLGHNRILRDAGVIAEAIDFIAS
ncbi:alpha/beta hydrolase [Hymenobacter glaciei]|uniref:Alpha/beta hydrolase n=1 Tax=Hymenobacter glaciei TaxID=877209 RepID=A0ABP7UPM7_9BACT